jgi:hypothetical protein
LVEVITRECRDHLLLGFFPKERLERLAWSLFFNKLSVPD